MNAWQRRAQNVSSGVLCSLMLKFENDSQIRMQLLIMVRKRAESLIPQESEMKTQPKEVVR